MTSATGADATADAIRRASPGVEFLLRFADAGHQAGYPSADLEMRVVEMAAAFRIPGAQVSATPTLVELSFGEIHHQQTYTLREQPASVDLDAMAHLDGLALQVLDGDVEPAAAQAALARITDNPLTRPWPVELGAYSLAGAALTPILGGGPREVAAGAVAGLVAGAVALIVGRTPRTEPMVAPLAAIAASFAASLIVVLGFDSSPDVVTLAAIVPLLPGMSLTIGMLELATSHLQSGLANTASSLVRLIGIVFGVAIGTSVATTWFGKIPHPHPSAKFSGVQLVASIVAGLAFTVTLRAGIRVAPMMCLACATALTANAAAAALVGDQAGVFVAATLVGVIGNLTATRLRHSSLVFIVPGILMLVPGSAGYDSVLRLLSGETVSGINAGVDTFVTAMSIAYGLMVAVVIVPRRLG